MATDMTDIPVRDESQAITRADPEQAAGALQHILATGDLSKLTNQQRVAYYLQRCASLGLNPLSRPFDWLILDGKLVLYDNKSCAEQLRRIHQISVKVTRFDVVGDKTSEPMVVCTVEGRRPNGQTDESTKYVSLVGRNGRLTGKDLANAYAKAETGAKRRVAFSMIGMAAPPDPDELERALPVVVDGAGRIIERPDDRQKALAADPRLARAIGEPTYEDAPRPATGWAPFADSPDQRPTIEELTPPARPYQPRQTFHCDAVKWRATWFTVVKDTFLDSDDARHDFIRWYTSGWPTHRQTDSLTVFLSRATDRQAEQLVNTARETIADRAQAEAEDPDGEWDGIDGISAEDADREAVRQAGYEARPTTSDDVRAAAMVTGAAPAKTTTAEPLARPEEGKSYTDAEWRLFYVEHAARMRKLDVTFRPADPDKLKGAALREAVNALIGEADAIEELQAADDADRTAAEQPSGPAF